MFNSQRGSPGESDTTALGPRGLSPFGVDWVTEMHTSPQPAGTVAPGGSHLDGPSFPQGKRAPTPASPTSEDDPVQNKVFLFRMCFSTLMGFQNGQFVAEQVFKMLRVYPTANGRRCRVITEGWHRTRRGSPAVNQMPFPGCPGVRKQTE